MFIISKLMFASAFFLQRSQIIKFQVKLFDQSGTKYKSTPPPPFIRENCHQSYPNQTKNYFCNIIDVSLCVKVAETN